MAKKNRELSRTERAAALQAEQARAERNRRFGIIGAVVVAIALIAGALFWTQRGGSDDLTVDTAMPASVGEQSLKIGPDDAEHKVVIWEDFLCPYCREFEEDARDLLHRAAKDGDVQVEYRPFQLLGDDYSKEALAAFATVLQNATPQEALAYHDLLYKNQPYEAGNKPDAEKIAGWAGELGLSEDDVLAGIEDGQAEWATAARQAAEKEGIQGTPTIFVDGQPLQGQSISDMVDNLEQQIS